MGTPLSLSAAQLLAAFEKGWKHEWRGEPQAAYYIGREHRGFTEVRVVRSVSPGEAGYAAFSNLARCVASRGSAMRCVAWMHHASSAVVGTSRTAPRASRASLCAAAPT